MAQSLTVFHLYDTVINVYIFMAHSRTGVKLYGTVTNRGSCIRRSYQQGLICTAHSPTGFISMAQ